MSKDCQHMKAVADLNEKLCPLREHSGCYRQHCEWWSRDIGHCIVHRLLSNIGLAADLELLETDSADHAEGG